MPSGGSEPDASSPCAALSASAMSPATSACRIGAQREHRIAGIVLRGRRELRRGDVELAEIVGSARTDIDRLRIAAARAVRPIGERGRGQHAGERGEEDGADQSHVVMLGGRMRPLALSLPHRARRGKPVGCRPPRSHVGIVGSAAALGHHPVDVLGHVLDVAGLAVDAILRVDLEPRLLLLAPDDLVDAGRAVALLGALEELEIDLDRYARRP